MPARGGHRLIHGLHFSSSSRNGSSTWRNPEGPVLKAILSDLHGNLEATNAVLEDMARFPVDQLLLLGDLVGYGPNPGECINLMERADIAILGILR